MGRIPYAGQDNTLSSFQYHYARLIDSLLREKIEQLLDWPDILSDHVRAMAEPNHGGLWHQRSSARHPDASLQD